MGNGDALELMKASHKRSQKTMTNAKPCTAEAHAAVVDGITTSQSDSEIIYVAVQELPEKITDTIKSAQPAQPNLTKKWGVLWHPIESRDIPRVILAVGVIILVLEKFGALEPFLSVIAGSK